MTPSRAGPYTAAMQGIWLILDSVIAVLALVLGDLAENALRQSLIMSQGSLGVFFTRPIACAITIVALFFLLMPIITPWWRRLRGLQARGTLQPGW